MSEFLHLQILCMLSVENRKVSCSSRFFDSNYIGILSHFLAIAVSTYSRSQENVIVPRVICKMGHSSFVLFSDGSGTRNLSFVFLALRHVEKGFSTFFFQMFGIFDDFSKCGVHCGHCEAFNNHQISHKKKKSLVQLAP